MLGSNDTPKRPTRTQSLDTLQSSATSKKTDVSPMGSSKKSYKSHRRGSTGPSDGSTPVSRRSSLKHGSRGSPVPPRRSSLSSSKRHNTPAAIPDFDADINDSEEKDDNESLPDLVEDVIVRWQMVGHRGGKEWNIQEDTPAGHAEEKLTIVVAVESDNESVISRNWYARDDNDDDDDDDDTIHDIPDDQSFLPLRNRNSLPSDPSSAQGSVPTQDLSVRDRFDPSFNNVDMWSKDVHVDQIKFRSTRSADRSILSECHSSDFELVSELGNSEVLDLDQPPHTPDEYRETFDTGGGTTASKTPATFKQSGSRRLTKMHQAPTLDVLSHDAAGTHPESVPEDGLLDGTSDQQVPRRANKSGRSERKGSHSTGRSSYNRTRKDRDPMRGRRQGKVPSTVAATPTVDEKVRSPLSSSMTSTPNSISLLSSLKSQQQHQSLESLRLRHSKAPSSPKGRSRPLNLHVGREEFSPSDGDDYTLGASTITTNFSTTQRTRGDNTVSTRSLFQSERMHISESLRIPQRASEGTAMDEQGGDAKFLPPVQPRRSIDNHLLDGQDMADFVTNLEESIDASADSLPSSPVGDPNRSVLRRPSGADDELLPEVGTDVSTNQAQLSPVPRSDDVDEADELNRLSGERFENSPVSPNDSRRSKKKNRLGLFRMKQGWQMGAVKLEDDEEEA